MCRGDAELFLLRLKITINDYILNSISNIITRILCDIKIVLLLHTQVSLMLEHYLFQFNLLVFCSRNAGGYTFLFGELIWWGSGQNTAVSICSSVAVGQLGISSKILKGCAKPKIADQWKTVHHILS